MLGPDPGGKMNEDQNLILQHCSEINDPGTVPYLEVVPASA